MTTPLMENVLVRSVDSCANAVCSALNASGSTMIWPSGYVRVVLENSASIAWTLYVDIPTMPDSYFVVGDAYDLVLGASIDRTFYTTVNQTLTLSQNGRLMVLGVNLASFYGPLWPPHPADDLTLEQADRSCFQPRAVCAVSDYAVQVTHGAFSATVGPGETALVGTLFFVSSRFEEVARDSNCDEKSQTVMAGYETNVCHGTGASCLPGPSSCCGDAQAASVCVGGIWMCPSGWVPAASCTGSGMDGSSCAAH